MNFLRLPLKIILPHFIFVISRNHKGNLACFFEQGFNWKPAYFSMIVDFNKKV